MRYGQIRKYDVANGPGVRTSLFVTGCKHNCFNCFNKDYQDFKAGRLWTGEDRDRLIEYLSLDQVKGLSLLGGEPMENAGELVDIIRDIKQFIKKDIWLWSGFRLEEIMEDEDKLALLREVDVLVDGKFVEKLKDLNLKFRGSSNQRIIDVRASLDSGRPVLLDI